jgi:putative hydrolase of the HAD superfamily
VLTTSLVEALARFGAAEGVDLQDLMRAALGAYAGMDDELVTGFETGHISEDDFCRAFASRLERLSGRRIAPRGLVARLFDVRIDDAMVGAVAAARRAGLRTGLLSNSWGHSLYPRELLDELFDAVVLSGDVGLRKPDPAIFELTTSRLGVSAPECVFVDDDLGHLEAAAARGMTTVLHHAPEATRAELERLLGVPLG